MNEIKTLEDWGWNEKLNRHFTEFADEALHPGRVLSPGRGLHRIAVLSLTSDDSGERDAKLSGKALRRGDQPAAGDWIIWREEGGTTLIEGILPRRTQISRKAAGSSIEEQVMAANVDVLFIVQALGIGRSFTPRGLERYAAMAWESGCRPVVILNKADLAEDPAGDIVEAEASAPGVEILLCSAADGSGIDTVKAVLSPGETAAFVGPSGAGKSSLVNAIAGEALTGVGTIRTGDGRGRHTTTRRELHMLEDGRLLLDTPGLRELQLWGDEGMADAAFPEIEEAAENCRFRDCRHENEPGCGVRAGLEDGSIAADRFDAWLELRKELSWLEIRRDEKARKEREQKWIAIAKASRSMKKGKEIW